jgi:PPOX class probable F420-dependent enzyme
MVGMDLDSAIRFVRDNHRAVLATTRSDGTPQMSPVLVGVDGPEGRRLVISTRTTALKVRNLRRDSGASLCVFSDGFFGPWVQISGTAEIVRLPEAMEMLVAYYRGISGEHPDWDDYRASMVREKRCVISITPERAGPDRSG